MTRGAGAAAGARRSNGSGGLDPIAARAPGSAEGLAGPVEQIRQRPIAWHDLGHAGAGRHGERDTPSRQRHRADLGAHPLGSFPDRPKLAMTAEHLDISHAATSTHRAAWTATRRTQSVG